MTRKRYIKLLMANGWSRNNAENTAGLGIDECKPNRSSKTFDERFWKKTVSHRGCWPCDTYDELLDFCFDADMLRRHSMPVEPPVSIFKEV
jgi:hypothetical protein|nr:MAG TPA: hypothetical protein [Caudoviricetes sp.]